jgi:signal peptidase I
MDEAGRVSVNGVALDEPYVFVDRGATIPVPDEHSWTVGDDQLFVLGDHRNRSDDSRVFGVIPVDRVVGRAFISYWPPPEIRILQTPTYPPLDG